MAKKKTKPASLYELDPREVDDDAFTARWLVRRPNTTTRTHLCGYKINDEEQGCLVRDEQESYEIARIIGWRTEPFGEDRKPFAPTPEEISAMPIELRPFDWLLRQANNLKHDAAEISGHPTRAELLGFIRDKSKVLREGIRTNLDRDGKPVQTADQYREVIPSA